MRAHALDPGRRLAPGLAHRAPTRLGGLGLGCRIRPEELDLALLGVEVAQRVGHELVGDVALAVDEEAVAPQPTLHGTRFELREVDGPRGELLEDAEERPRPVLPLEADDRRLVVAGGGGDPAPEHHEAGLVLGVVLDVGSEDVEVVQLCRQGSAQGGEPLAPGAGDRLDCFGRRVRGEHVGGGQGAQQPVAALRRGVWVARDRRDVGELRARTGAEVERDRQHDLTLDQQLGVEGERVEGDVDRTFDGILDRDDPQVGLPGVDRGDDVGHRLDRYVVLVGEVRLGEQGLFGERAGRAQERDAGHGRAS